MLKETKNCPVEFSVDYDGNMEDLDLGGNDITEDEIETLIKKVIDSGELILGERSTGLIEIFSNKIVFDYQYCEDVGEDWDSDVWVEEKFDIPNE